MVNELITVIIHIIDIAGAWHIVNTIGVSFHCIVLLKSSISINYFLFSVLKIEIYSFTVAIILSTVLFFYIAVLNILIPNYLKHKYS